MCRTNVVTKSGNLLGHLKSFYIYLLSLIAVMNNYIYYTYINTMNEQRIFFMVTMIMATSAISFKTSKKFMVSKHKVGFHDAFITCHQYGLEPAEILTEEEHKLVEHLLRNEKQTGAANGFWLSATNLDSKQSYYWLNSGRQLFYSNFSAGQPDNYKNNENCLHVFHISSGHFGWNDIPCNAQQRFLCQYNEEPSSICEDNKVSVL